MKAYVGYGLAMLTGAVLGAAAISGLQAQSRPLVYTVSEIDVTNPEAYVKEFLAKVGPLNAAAGGRALIRTSGKITPIEGDTPRTRVTISSWDSVGKAQAFYNSADYKELRKVGDRYAKFIRVYAVEGVSE
jgi:uncharacterized protein (DUF1330 family)